MLSDSFQKRTCRLSRGIHVLGALVLVAFIAQAILSWLLSSSLSHDAVTEGGVQQRRFLMDLANAHAWLPEWYKVALRGEGVLRSDLFFFASYYAPLLLQTACFTVALVLVRRGHRESMDEVAACAYRWAIAFSLTTLFSYPTLTQDIWLSVVWGKMAVAGVDPFTITFDDSFTAGLPLDHDPIRMTYGPLWLLICMAAVFISGSSALLAFFLLKLVLLASWLLCLRCIRDIALRENPSAAALAIVVLGWLPVGVHASVAEGHNDVAMMALALVWLKLLHSTSFQGPLALAGSFGLKFVTAPLAAVDLLYNVRTGGLSPSDFARRYLPGAVLAASVLLFMLLDYRYSQAGGMAAWRYLAPTDLLTLAERAFGVAATGQTFKAALAVAGFGTLAAWRLWRLWSEPTAENVILAQLAIMSAVLFGLVGHTWPWFFVWVLPFAALAPRYWLSVFVISAAMVSPFTIAHWWRLGISSTTAPLEHHLIPSLIMFGFATMASIAWGVRRYQASR